MSAERQTSLLESPGIAAAAAAGERKWKNPNDVVRIRRKLSRKPSLKLTGKPQGENVHYSRQRNDKPRTPVLKRTCENVTVSPTPPKRSRSGLQDISNSPLVTTPEKPTKPSNPQVATPTEHRQPQLSLTLTDSLGCDIRDCTIPLDWALKTKIRFVSPFPFSWTQSLKPHQEATGITNFVTNTRPQESCDKQASLQRGLMVWCHPSLPFLKLFPRTETRGKPTLTLSLLQDQQLLQALRDDWSSSLCSVYQLLRCGLCPYFYLCANQYTVLFVSAGVRGCSSLSALITPTTSGMREALQREGAELNLPLAPSQLPAYDDEGSDAEDDGAAATWLSAMGLPPHDLPTLQPQALQRSNEVNIDSHPESVAYVEGSGSVHVLFNFLLTSKTTITTTGAQAGIPPTILSPVGFQGATLKALKAKQSSVQELSEGQMVQRYYIEISGPILPLNLHTLSRLFCKTQHGHFTASMNNVDGTGAFNASIPTGHRAENAQTLTEPYLQNEPLGQKHGLKKLTCEGHNITWE